MININGQFYIFNATLMYSSNQFLFRWLNYIFIYIFFSCISYQTINKHIQIVKYREYKNDITIKHQYYWPRTDNNIHIPSMQRAQD